MSNFKVLYHSSIVIDDNIYVDPYKIPKGLNKASIIFITHPHYDHYSPDDIKQIINNNTMIVSVPEVVQDLSNQGINVRTIQVRPNASYNVGGISFTTFSSYNIDKKFHPKQNGWVGYIININSKLFAIVGDSDCTPELQSIKCDVLFIPIGGTYTMDAKQAAQATNKIQPKVVVPTHYNSIVGSKNDENTFKDLVDKKIQVKTFM